VRIGRRYAGVQTLARLDQSGVNDRLQFCSIRQVGIAVRNWGAALLSYVK